MRRTLRIALAAAVLQIVPLVASAQNITNICSVLRLANTAITWFGILVFIVAVLAILYAGFLFLTSGGNEETTKKARQVLLWGLIGIAVALLAVNAISFVSATVGGNTFNVNNCVTGVN